MKKKKINKKCRAELVDVMDAAFSLPGYKDYINENFGVALDVAHDGNCMSDLDCIVHLSKLLGFKVSYNLYCYIDNHYDESLLELTKEDLPELWKIIDSYI